MKRHAIQFNGAARGRAATEVLALDPRALGVTYYVDEPKEEDYRYGASIERVGKAAIVRVSGPLEHYASWFDGYESCKWRVGICERFAIACADKQSEAVVLVLDSPGGECAGLLECVRIMRAVAAESGKRIVAYVNESAYSAAYALATVASEIVLPPSGGVGSIGVIAELLDFVGMNQKFGINVAVVSAGAHKADGHPDLPISDEAIATLGERVQTLAAQFYDLVSEARPLSSEEVASLEAACLYGQEAVDAGLADAVGGLPELLGELLGKTNDGAMAAPGQETTTMKRKSALGTMAAVLASAHTPIATSVASVSAGDPEAYKRSETSTVTEETESTDEETGQTTKTTTTTTTESETTEAAPKGEGDDDSGEGGDDDDDDDDEGDGDAKAIGRAAGAAALAAASQPVVLPAKAGATTRDVLAAVRTITGQATLGGQLGALEAIAAQAAKVPGLEAKIAEIGAEAAHRDMKARAAALPPAMRAKAIGIGAKHGAEAFDAFMDAVAPMLASSAPTTPKALRAPPVATKGAAGAAGTEAVSDPALASLTPEERAVAKSLHVDPAKLAAFKAGGFKVPTITH